MTYLYLMSRNEIHESMKCGDRGGCGYSWLVQTCTLYMLYISDPVCMWFVLMGDKR